MKVGIWGAYNHGNYGDDLMAIQFSKALQNLGADPYVYRLDQQLADRYSVKTVDSLKMLVEGAKFCILGGGAFLNGLPSSDQRASPQNSIYSKTDKDLSDFLTVVSEEECPIFPVSVGGDGRGVNTILSSAREKFWKSPLCTSTSVRLHEDVALLNKLGRSVHYYPDVLWSVDSFWKIPDVQQDDRKLHVGINIQDSWRSKLLTFQLIKLAHLKKNIVFHFVRTKLPGYENSDILPNFNSPYIKTHIYTDPYETLCFVKSLNLVVSSKLHLGLTALSLRVPFYSYAGRGKTISFMKSIQADSAIWAPSQFLKLGMFITKSENILNAKESFDFSAFEKIKRDSYGHIKQLDRAMQTLA